MARRMTSHWIDGELVHVDVDVFDRLVERRIDQQPRRPRRTTSEQVFGPWMGETRRVRRMPTRSQSNPNRARIAPVAPGCTPPSGNTRRRYTDLSYPLALAREAAVASQAALAESQAKLAEIQAQIRPTN